MGVFATLFGGAAAQPIEAIGNAIDQTFTTDEERLAARNTLAQLAMQPAILQIELAKVEAQHRSLFVAGWRPAIGWICAGALAWEFVLAPAIAWTFDLTPPGGAPALMELTMWMLGLAGLRTFEKIAGKAK